MRKHGAFLLWVEMLVLLGMTPLVIWYFKSRLLMAAVLWISALIIYLWLHRGPKISLWEEWNWQGFKTHVRPVMIRFAVLAPVLFGFMAFMHPDRLFSFPLERFDRWVMVMILYPLLSVLPQELIYKTLFFRRYGTLFTNQTFLLVFSAAAFGYMHIMLGNIVAVAGTAIAGYLIGQSYMKSQSLALACFEHALYGCWVYTLGLGIYFYTGAAWGQP